jgi:GGDEF domain-containing protein
MALKGDDRGAEALLLEYMWLRPGFVLEPVADWRHPRRYRYPILEALDRSESDPENWLKRLEQENLIERVELKDRQRECDFCGSAHLSFVDVCPNCRSIEIDQHSALHCFTCGFIAPEERFQQGEHKVCPKCGVRLRHIGSDYDRPMETSACRNCDHIFVEGDVIARCAICAHSMPPTELRLHQIFSWRLSGLGRLAAQGRRGVHATTTVDALNYATYDHFLNKLDWVLKIACQQRDFTFAVLGLRLDNYVELNQTLGTGRAAELLDAFAERLREPLTEADLGARPDPESLWLLLPDGSRKRLDKLHRWVQQLTNQARQEDGIGPIWRSVELTLDSKDARTERGESVLTRLRAALDGGEEAAARPPRKRSGPRSESEPPVRIEPEVGPVPTEAAPHRLAPRVG